MTLSKLLCAPLVAVALALAPSPLLADGEHGAAEHGELADEYVEGASRLEGRVLAPCCWNQTIDIHGSPVSNDLRREIRRRLKAGESADAIEASIIDRYGDRVLAVPPKSPLKKVAIGLSILMGAAGVGAVFMVMRWRRRSQAQAQQSGGTKGEPRDAELDKRLDEELANLDG